MNVQKRKEMTKALLDGSIDFSSLKKGVIDGRTDRATGMTSFRYARTNLESSRDLNHAAVMQLIYVLLKRSRAEKKDVLRYRETS